MSGKVEQKSSDAAKSQTAEEAEPKGLPNSDRAAAETAHHHPTHGAGVRTDGEPGPTPKPR